MKNKITLLLFALIFSVVPFLARADGGIVYKPLPDGDWTWGDEGSQEAFINYENGIEKLIIGVDVKKENSEMAWIVPVPGQPEKINLDISSGLPTFFGDEVISKAKMNLSDNLEGPYMVSYLGQIWPIFSGFWVVNMASAPNGAATNGLESGLKADSAVSVMSHIEKEGIVSELVTAKDSQAIYNYLSQKGFNLGKDAVPQLDHYIGEDYSFVISWLAPQIDTASARSQKGIFVSFPIEKIYYPLVLTSVYGEKQMPISIRVVGHVLPDIPAELKSYTKVDYFTDRTKGGGGARGASCKTYMDQLKSTMAIFYNDNGYYPENEQELFNSVADAKILLEKIKQICSPALYTSDGKNYSVQATVYNGAIWEIDSFGNSGFSSSSVITGFSSSSELQKFYGNAESQNGKGEYTKIEINAPAKLLREDLWMEQGRPFKISVALWVIDNAKSFGGLAGYLLIVGILSFLAGGLAGLLCYNKFWRYAFIGLGNIFTLIGLIIAFRSSQAKNKQRPRFKIGFEFCFSVIFILLLSLLPISSEEKPVLAIFSLIGAGLFFILLSAGGRSADSFLAGEHEAAESIADPLIGKKTAEEGIGPAFRGALSAAFFISFFVYCFLAITILSTFSNLGILCLIYFSLLLIWHSIRSLSDGKPTMKANRFPTVMLLVFSSAVLLFLGYTLFSIDDYDWSRFFNYFHFSLYNLGLALLILFLAALWTEFVARKHKAGEGALRIIISDLLIVFSASLFVLLESSSAAVFLVIAVAVFSALTFAWLAANSLAKKYKEGKRIKLILMTALFLDLFVVLLFVSFLLLAFFRNF